MEKKNGGSGGGNNVALCLPAPHKVGPARPEVRTVFRSNHPTADCRDRQAPSQQGPRSSPSSTSLSSLSPDAAYSLLQVPHKNTYILRVSNRSALSKTVPLVTAVLSNLTNLLAKNKKRPNTKKQSTVLPPGLGGVRSELHGAQPKSNTTHAGGITVAAIRPGTTCHSLGLS